MLFVVLSEAADRGELLLVSGGLCRFHTRRDGVTVIREIIVLPERRLLGIGKQLVSAVITACGVPVLAKCPRSYPANAFWQRLGFVKEGESNGICEWWLRS